MNFMLKDGTRRIEERGREEGVADKGRERKKGDRRLKMREELENERERRVGGLRIEDQGTRKKMGGGKRRMEKEESWRGGKVDGRGEGSQRGRG